MRNRKTAPRQDIPVQRACYPAHRHEGHSRTVVHGPLPSGLPDTHNHRGPVLSGFLLGPYQQTFWHDSKVPPLTNKYLWRMLYWAFSSGVRGNPLCNKMISPLSSRLCRGSLGSERLPLEGVENPVPHRPWETDCRTARGQLRIHEKSSTRVTLLRILRPLVLGGSHIRELSISSIST